LLLQTARTKDNESRVGTVRNHGRWVHDRGSSQSRVKCANPVAAWSRALEQRCIQHTLLLPASGLQPILPEVVQ
jgi:hypothetical protein